MYVFIGMVLIGALLFALWRMSGTAKASGSTGGGSSARPNSPSARKPTRREPLPPDDNPDFLRELDRRARRDDDPPA